MVTGGAGGIGAEVCRELSRRGAAVAITDLEQDAVDAVAAELRANGARSAGYAVDVRDPAQVRAVTESVAAEFGGLNLLVTLAGGSLGTPRDLDEIGPDDLDLVVDVNLKGTFYCCQAAGPYLQAAVAAGGAGAVVTVSSIGGRQPSPVTGVPYASSKAAVVGLTKRLASEWGPSGVRVNAVAPGLFLTGRLRRMYDDMPAGDRRAVLDAIALARFPEVREIVEPICYLLSGQASYITGVVLDVNGGRFMPL
ncbi:SDR family oxidoreductase [Phytoactinopolyspora sp. XMNu-373]|uniref:SDR family oxidoreductase n=2 Tax=Phytoactinopolyspora mesophila TaxID=2650750 RepID=A0A7K3M7V0_9ACTN|nr:SDR family NAD(P)-dependent oxidoreductase [Phytoactinopolyspora mesophila]NDL59366.1 SDR family oxidoreductase [Phytoactinopolyspora mesophila]